MVVVMDALNELYLL